MVSPNLRTSLTTATVGVGSFVWSSAGQGSDLALLAQAAAPQTNRLPPSRSYFWETGVVVIVSLIALYTVCRSSHRQ